ncbi:transcriptional repressor LexA [Treponema sp.]|uniref:transcriptional repressor LexA n=1 Tax=Treponema sp. TaxID=166 RepID=UPI001D47CEA7|nr:transcriptional repressor LexA [Treponema sp.]MBS7241892.1 transcriptional repressor LexA [Treponema sp.]MCI6443181.1 transcriptional repressor LexA [Spirochaetia bacterium]MDY4132902.1 transcriptional repressor LexA [Treponema sp.]
MKALTDRQKEVLEFIARFSEENGYPPTVREIGENFGISLRAVQDHIAACQKKGYLSQCQKRSRSFRVIKGETVQEARVFVTKVPKLGTIAAGKPLLAEENLDGYVTIAEPFVKPGKTYFALNVRGASMINAGILEGDLAIIEQSEIAAEGQIVVAVVDNAITLKRFYKEQNRVRLQPENPDFQPIYSSDVKIAGIMVGLVRTY